MNLPITYLTCKKNSVLWWVINKIIDLFKNLKIKNKNVFKFEVITYQITTRYNKGF